MIQSSVQYPVTVDLTHPLPLSRQAERLSRVGLDSYGMRLVESLARDPSHVTRVTRLCDQFRDLEPEASAEILLAAGKLLLRRQPAGARIWFSAINVRPPGVEVLRRLQALSCLERVSLRLVAGTWREPDDSDEENPVFPILELLAEAARIGVVDIGVERLPRKPEAIQALQGHLRRWFAWATLKLSASERLPDDTINFLVQLCMLELSLAEKRVSRLAESIDPYDTRGMARLMPLLSRYDQDIEHMKSVVSRLTTYKPFYERMLTLENAITSGEMTKITKVLRRHTGGEAPFRVLEALRANPILDREFFSLTSLTYQIATLRGLALEEALPDVLSVMYMVLSSYQQGESLDVEIEHDLIEEMWPILRTWGMVERAPWGLTLTYREERSLDFILPDGTPRLPEQPEPLDDSPEASIEQLVRSQINNDAFLIGVLENPRAVETTRVVSIIVTLSRSVRVLEKICHNPRLHSGEAKKDVPRLMLLNPARLPIGTLRRFIHVRFVNKLDLKRMAMPQFDVRREVQNEIRAYLRTLSG